jgi:hypothetical protein
MTEQPWRYHRFRCQSRHLINAYTHPVICSKTERCYPPITKAATTKQRLVMLDTRKFPRQIGHKSSTGDRRMSHLPERSWGIGSPGCHFAFCTSFLDLLASSTCYLRVQGRHRALLHCRIAFCASVHLSWLLLQRKWAESGAELPSSQKEWSASALVNEHTLPHICTPLKIQEKMEKWLELL